MCIRDSYIVGLDDRFQPGTEQDGEVQRGQRAFAYDHWMHELHRDMPVSYTHL